MLHLLSYILLRLQILTLDSFFNNISILASSAYLPFKLVQYFEHADEYKGNVDTEIKESGDDNSNVGVKLRVRTVHEVSKHH